MSYVDVTTVYKLFLGMVLLVDVCVYLHTDTHMYACMHAATIIVVVVIVIIIIIIIWLLFFYTKVLFYTLVVFLKKWA
jgi:hypothetical protein